MADTVELQYLERVSKSKEVLDEFTVDFKTEVFLVNEKISERCLLSRPILTNEILYGTRNPNPIDLDKCKYRSRNYVRGVVQKWFLEHLDCPNMTSSELQQYARKTNRSVKCIRQILVSMRKLVRQCFRSAFPIYASLVC